MQRRVKLCYGSLSYCNTRTTSRTLREWWKCTGNATWKRRYLPATVLQALAETTSRSEVRLLAIEIVGIRASNATKRREGVGAGCLVRTANSPPTPRLPFEQSRCPIRKNEDGRRPWHPMTGALTARLRPWPLNYAGSSSSATATPSDSSARGGPTHERAAQSSLRPQRCPTRMDTLHYRKL